MRKHETGCTANPNRVCGYCGRDRPVAELGDLLGSRGSDWQAGMAALRAETRDCPGCILAAIRQGRHHQPVAGEPWDPARRQGLEWATAAGAPGEFGFDFQAEKAAWWQAHPRPPRPALAALNLESCGEFVARLQAALSQTGAEG